eukprot:6128796-Alexandrium_andersonii.AAC.1
MPTTVLNFAWPLSSTGELSTGRTCAETAQGAQPHRLTRSLGPLLWQDPARSNRSNGGVRLGSS